MSGAGPDRPTFARYREILAAAGFRPSRRLGQNFLLDPSLHRAIVGAAELDSGTTVLEVGAGIGFLTRELARAARRVLTVEIDSRLVAVLRSEIDTWEGGSRVEIIESDVLGRGDALAPPVAAALEHVDPPLAVVANLPYAVSGRFLVASVAMTGGPAAALGRIVVVVQRELAERIVAAPGSRTYGGISVLAQARGSAEIVRWIGREVFRPRPNVDSALLRLRCERPLPTGFAPFVRTLFERRRKTLRHALDRLGVPTDAAIRQHWGGRRAEQCSAAEILELFSTIQPGGGSADPS